jgi:hypothetical protein
MLHNHWFDADHTHSRCLFFDMGRRETCFPNGSSIAFGLVSISFPCSFVLTHTLCLRRAFKTEQVAWQAGIQNRTSCSVQPVTYMQCRHAFRITLLRCVSACMLPYRCVVQGLSPLWALSHFGVLLLCAMVALAGMIVALVRFGNTITGLVMSTHQVLGLLSVGEGVCTWLMHGVISLMAKGVHAAHAMHVFCPVPAKTLE